MKRLVSVLLIVAMSLCLCSCGEKNGGDNAPNVQTTAGKEHSANEILWDADMTFEELKLMIEQDTEDTISALSTEWETLKKDVDTYDKYLDNVDIVEAFYEKIYEETELLSIRLREYCLIYAKMIVNSDMSYDDMYDELEEIYDELYEDAGEAIYDEIYDGILDEMYEYYYDGILDDAYEDAEYAEWSDARSEEYEWWSDARSDVYGEYSDFRSDAYGFYSDLRSEVYDEDMDNVMEEIEDFEEDVMKMKE